MNSCRTAQKGNMRVAEIPQTAFPRWVPILTSILRSSRGDFSLRFPTTAFVTQQMFSPKCRLRAMEVSAWNRIIPSITL
jgi:hypothetical protein